jgi:hypothetical protein
VRVITRPASCAAEARPGIQRKRARQKKCIAEVFIGYANATGYTNICGFDIYYGIAGHGNPIIGVPIRFSAFITHPGCPPPCPMLESSTE